ncbi:S9 family peptidase [Myxococcota bacterium]
MPTKRRLLPVCIVLISGCTTQRAAPPVAKIVPHQLTHHGHTRVDNYYWLNQRESPEVRGYLEAENRYYEARMGHLASFEDALFDEIVARIKKDDDTVPYLYRGYFYYDRYEAGKEYPIFCRKNGSLDAEEEILVDANTLAEGHEFFSIRGVVVNSNDNILAFATDTVGRRFYTIRFKDLASGEMLADTIPRVTGNLTWAEDGETLFYGKQNPETLRSHRIYRHRLGADPSRDALVYEEEDETFSVYTWKTKSRRYVMVGSFHTLSSEIRFLPADSPTETPTVFLLREPEHEYTLGHLGDHFYVRTNWKAKNFRLMKTPVAQTKKESWTEVIAHRDDVLLETFELFDDHLVAAERKDGLLELRVRALASGEEHEIDFGEPAYVAWPMDNWEPGTSTLRYWYSSLTTPGSVFDYDMVTRKKTLRKRDEVLGDFDPERYLTERLYAPARDDESIPISLVYRKGLEKDGSRPLLLHGYGAYGASVDPMFWSARLSLLDRGFVFAIAHVRGGEELGRRWYEDGRQLDKKNTFTDFIDCAEYLLTEGYGDSARVYASGGSAGGLLIGAVVNMRPDLFTGVIADVPFVDVVTTMLDDSIPLTTSEFDEWGNPKDEAYYDYMLSYSPYDNVEPQAYPHMLITTSLNDSQVQYWEPAKWVAKLRALKTDDNLLLLKTNMEAGHGGISGRFKRHRDTATSYSFLLHLAGLID